MLWMVVGVCQFKYTCCGYVYWGYVYCGYVYMLWVCILYTILQVYMPLQVYTHVVGVHLQVRPHRGCTCVREVSCYLSGGQRLAQDT
jgi:hypothetical protein